MRDDSERHANQAHSGRRLIAFIALTLILVGQIFLIPSKEAATVPLMFLLTAIGVGLFILG